MCKCHTTVTVDQFKTFITNTLAGDDEVVVGAKANMVIKTPTSSHEMKSGTLYRLPKSQARDLIEKKVPLWIVT